MTPEPMREPRPAERHADAEPSAAMPRRRRAPRDERRDERDDAAAPSAASATPPSDARCRR